MTDYKKWEEKIWLYLDGHLRDPEREVLLRAVEGDDQLRTLLENCKAMHIMLKEDLPEQPSVSFTSQVMSQIDYPSSVASSRTGWKKAAWLFVAGGAIVMIFSVYLASMGEVSGTTNYPFIMKLVTKLTEWSFFRNLAWLSTGIFLLIMIDQFFLAIKNGQRSINPV